MGDGSPEGTDLSRRRRCRHSGFLRELTRAAFLAVRGGLGCLSGRLDFEVKRRLTMLLLIIVLLLLFGGGGGYYGYSRWGTGGGVGILGTVVLIAVVLYLVGGLR